MSELIIREHLKKSLEQYFSQLDGSSPSNLYKMVLNEIEVPLLQTVMKYAHGNQCHASELLGISRSTLRKKLSEYGMDKKS